VNQFMTFELVLGQPEPAAMTDGERSFSRLDETQGEGACSIAGNVLASVSAASLFFSASVRVQWWSQICLQPGEGLNIVRQVGSVRDKEVRAFCQKTISSSSDKRVESVDGMSLLGNCVVHSAL
jgi:hypothetical protein